MIRIAICCGEGFASGFLAKHLSECAVSEGLSDKVSFTFIPFDNLYDRQDEVDIAMLMPHVEYKAKAEKRPFSIPLYVIPYKVAVKVRAKDFLEDAEDILNGFRNMTGLVTFADEEQPSSVTRLVSHRRYTAEHRA